MDPRVPLDQLFGQRGIHVVDVGDARHRARHRRNERRLLHGMDEVVPGAPDHLEALGDHDHVTDHLLERESRPHVSNAGEPRNAVNPAVGNAHILAFVERQHIHLVPARAEKLEHRPYRQRSPPRLEERVWREDEDLHPAGPTVEPNGRSRRVTSAISAASRSRVQPRQLPAIRATPATVSRERGSRAPNEVRRRIRSESRTAISSRMARSTCSSSGRSAASSGRSILISDERQETGSRPGWPPRG